MKLCQWKPKKYNLTVDEFFDFDNPFFNSNAFPAVKGFSSAFEDWNPAVDIVEENDSYVVKADIPGVDKKDISLEVHGAILTIKGERKVEEEKKEKSLRRVERSYGSFQRSFDLGEAIDQSKIKAKYKDGVLEVVVPKSEQTVAQAIAIE